jgi:hypothetical protein
MLDPSKPGPAIFQAMKAGGLVECVVLVPICAGASVPVRVIVAAGDGWEQRAKTCALMTVEAIRNRLRAQALEGDTE